MGQHPTHIQNWGLYGVKHWMVVNLGSVHYKWQDNVEVEGQIENIHDIFQIIYYMYSIKREKTFEK